MDPIVILQVASFRLPKKMFDHIPYTDKVCLQ